MLQLIFAGLCNGHLPFHPLRGFHTFFSLYTWLRHIDDLSLDPSNGQPSSHRSVEKPLVASRVMVSHWNCPNGPNRCIRVMCALGTGTVYIYICRYFFSSLSFPVLIFALPNINLWITSPCIKNWLPSFSRQTRISMMNNGSAWKSRKTAKMLGVSLVAGC